MEKIIGWLTTKNFLLTNWIWVAIVVAAIAVTIIIAAKRKKG